MMSELESSDFVESKFLDERSPLVGQDEVGGRCVEPAHAGVDTGLSYGLEVSRFDGPREEDSEIGHPRIAGPLILFEKHQEHVDLKLRETIMHGAEVELVDPKGLAIDLPTVGATVAIRTEGNEIFVIVGLACAPGDDVVKVHFDVSTGRDGASMPGLDQHAAA